MHLRSAAQVHSLIRYAAPETVASIKRVVLDFNKRPREIEPDEYSVLALLPQIQHLRIGIRTDAATLAYSSGPTYVVARWIETLLLGSSCALRIESVRIHDVGLEEELALIVDSLSKMQDPALQERWKWFLDWQSRRKAALDERQVELELVNQRLERAITERFDGRGGEIS